MLSGETCGQQTWIIYVHDCLNARDLVGNPAGGDPGNLIGDVL